MKWLAHPLGMPSFGVRSPLGPGMLYFRCNNLALNIRHCVSHAQDHLPHIAVCPFYLGSMPGEVKDPIRGKCVTCRGLHILLA